jgi:Protein of unknown function (DUF1569)
MSTLADPAALESLLQRFDKLHPERPRAWGLMTPNEMCCHLADSFAMALGERPFAPVDTWMRRNFMKWVALRTSYPSPRGLETRPEAKQGAGGTPPTSFTADRARAVDLLRRFAAPDARRGTHPFFGPMTTEEWLIWGYRHTDHHLRQFAL